MDINKTEKMFALVDQWKSSGKTKRFFVGITASKWVGLPLDEETELLCYIAIDPTLIELIWIEALLVGCIQQNLDL